MATLSSYAAIIAQLVSDVATAWDEMQVIYKGAPLVPPTATEFAIVSLADVAQVWQGVKAFTQTYTFTIVGQWRRPADETQNLLDLQVTKANLLALLLEPTAAHYASATDMYWVSKVLLFDGDEVEDVYRAGIEFTCTSTGTFGS